MSLSDLEPIDVLGRGAIGMVFLVRQRNTNSYYALKRMRKSRIVRRKLENQVSREIKLLTEMKSNPFVSNIIRTFNDQDSLYILLEAGICGDLFSFFEHP